jgi:hypothetical protein
VIALAILVAIDGAGSGFRAAAGRSARIDKLGWYARAMARGVACSIAVMALALVFAWWVADAEFWASSASIAWRCATIYGLVGAPVIALLIMRMIPSVDLRSISSTLVFGPLTALRPIIVVIGAWPALEAGGWHAILAAFIVCAMLLAEPILARWGTPQDR